MHMYLKMVTGYFGEIHLGEIHLGEIHFGESFSANVYFGERIHRRIVYRRTNILANG